MEIELNEIREEIRNHTSWCFGPTLFLFFLLNLHQFEFLENNINVQLRIANINTSTIASGYKLLDVVNKLDKDYGKLNDIKKDIYKTMKNYEEEMERVQENILKRLDKPMAELKDKTRDS